MTYRDEREAVETRRALLRRRLEEIQAQSGTLRALEAQASSLRAELEDAEARLAGGGPRRLPLLDAVQIAAPCSARWDDMAGDARRRRCSACDKHVYNIEAMTRAEAEQLLFETEGRACLRLYRRADGTVLTADCAVGVRRRRRRLVVAAVAGTALAAAMASAGAFATESTKTARAPISVGTLRPFVPTVAPAPPPVGPVGPLMGGPAIADPLPPRVMGRISPPGVLRYRAAPTQR